MKCIQRGKQPVMNAVLIFKGIKSFMCFSKTWIVHMYRPKAKIQLLYYYFFI